MPTRFLSSHQRAIYGRFAKDPSEDDLARFFLIETADHKIIQQLRGSTNRLGFAILLCGLKYTGSFIRNWEDVPEIVVTYLASQLAVESTIDLASYFDHAAPTYKRHCSMIRAHLGVRDLYSSRKALFGLTRRLYTLCWTGEDRPSHLMQWAIDWLMANAILLPGVTTLERLVGRVKDRVQTRLFQKLVEGITPQQRQQIHDLLNATGGWAELELLRSSPLKRTQSAFLNHLDRLDALRSFGLHLTPPKGVPARVLEKVARRTRALRTSAIYALQEPRRTACVAALFYTLEASAQDDGLELAEVLFSDLFRQAENDQAKERIKQQHLADKAMVTLHNIAVQVLAEDNELANVSFEVWRDSLFMDLPRDQIAEAITLVGSLTKASNSKPIEALNSRWPRAKKLFNNTLSRLDWDTAPNGAEIHDAMVWLRDQNSWGLPTLRNAPSGAIPKAWEPYVFDDTGQIINPKAYVFAVIDAWRSAVKRRDVFVTPAIRYADPRVGLLKGKDWQNTKAAVCRALSHSLDGPGEIERLAQLLDQTFRKVARGAKDNTDLKFETSNGKVKIAISPLDKIEENDSLKLLRKQSRTLLPKGGIPDILLEVMRRTGFNEAFTHLSERSAQPQGFETSLCAVVIAQACNIGLDPLITDTTALRRSRLSWCEQNFVRPETINQANARIVEAHNQLPITQHWGNGQIASADGLRFIAPQTAIHAGPNPKYFGYGRGVTWYNMISDRYTGLAATVVPGTLRDSLVLLALLLEQETELDPVQIMTDTAGYSDAIFGLFWLLGYQFSPRLADIGGARLWRIDKSADYGCFTPVIDGKINCKLIIDNWEDLMRLAGSLKLGHLKAEGIMRVLQVRDRPTTLAKALVQLGRIIKTLHVLNYVDNPDFRRKTLVQLNRQELRHKLARKIYHGDRGEVRNALKQGQEEQLGLLGVTLNAVVYWNSIYLQEALNQLKTQGEAILPEDIQRLSPILWAHINFLGKYEIALPESVANGGLRPLRDNSFEWDL